VLQLGVLVVSFSFSHLWWFRWKILKLKPSIDTRIRNIWDFFRIFDPYAVPETRFKVWKSQFRHFRSCKVRNFGTSRARNWRSNDSIDRIQWEKQLEFFFRIFRPHPSLEMRLEMRKTRFKHWKTFLEKRFWELWETGSKWVMMIQTIGLTARNTWIFFRIFRPLRSLETWLEVKKTRFKHWKTFVEKRFWEPYEAESNVLGFRR